LSQDGEHIGDTGQSLDLHQLIASRRSVRGGYSDLDVTQDVIKNILECGLSAPSSKNAQPWKLHVVNDREQLRSIARAILKAKTAKKYVPQDPNTGEPRDYDDTVEESAHVLGQVPLGIFVENDGTFTINREVVASAPDDTRVGAVFGMGLEYIGLGACIENMWLAANSFGLDGVFMGDAAIAEGSIREQLEMVGDLVGVLALGYSDQSPTPKTMKPERVIWH